MTVVLATEQWGGLGLALLMQRQGSEVICAFDYSGVAPKDLECTEPIGDGLVTKVTLDRAMRDMVGKYALWVFDANDFPKQADALRAKGELVIGTSRLAQQLEDDRQFAVEMAQQVGFAIPESEEFTDYPKGIAYLEAHPNQAWCYKPDAQDPTATYVPMEKDDPAKANEELREYMGSLKNGGQPKFMLQEVVTGTEVNFELWVSKGQPLAAFCDLEAKRKLVGDLGENVGCAGDYVFRIPQDCAGLLQTAAKYLSHPRLRTYTGSVDANVMVVNGKPYFLENCFDDQTEILTRDGWRLIKDVGIGTEVATLNRTSHELEYQTTTDLIVQPYDGEMVRLGGDSCTVDALATPNHRFYARRFDSNRVRYSPWLDIEAADLCDKIVLKRDAAWRGQEATCHIIPEYLEAHFTGWHKSYVKVVHPQKIVPMDDWLRFLAFYLSEGSRRTPNTVQISQRKHTEEMEAVLQRLPFEYRREKTGFVICSIQLSAHLGNAKCAEKSIPSWVKTLCPRQLRVFLDAYCLGDGSRHKKTGQVSYFTTSRVMADDLQEIILKAGSFANIKRQPTTGTTMQVGKGKSYQRRYDLYVVSERAERKDFWIVKRKHIRREHYCGNVYCVTVPNQTIYVRRNGKPLWASNCFRMGYNAYPVITQELLGAPMEEVFRAWVLGHPVDDMIRDGVGASLSIVVDHPKPGTPLIIPPEIAEHVYQYRGYFEDGLKIVEGWSEIACVTAHGLSLPEAGERCLELVRQVGVPDKGYRVDLATADVPTLPLARYDALVQMGWIPEQDEMMASAQAFLAGVG